MPMKIQNLEALFLEELRDAYDFEHQIIEALEKTEQAATDKGLKRAFRDHRRQTEKQVQRLERVFKALDQKPKRQRSQGMKGILSEGEKIARAEGDPASIDAALIAAAQRVEHYEIAAYGTLRALARQLGRDKEAKLLEEILDQEEKTDARLTELAEDGINQKAQRASAGNGQGRTERRGKGSRGRTTTKASGRRSSAADEETTRQELYERAKELDVEGRSKMSKRELARAVEQRT